LLDKWLAILPGAFTEADHVAGYRYELSILQAEFSLTQVLDQPVSGGCFSNRSSATISMPGDRIGSAWSSTVASSPKAAARLRDSSAPG
jgi:hypothetical protein